jgi:hypothetical protein
VVAENQSLERTCDERAENSGAATFSRLFRVAQDFTGIGYGRGLDVEVAFGECNAHAIRSPIGRPRGRPMQTNSKRFEQSLLDLISWRLEQSTGLCVHPDERITGAAEVKAETDPTVLLKLIEELNRAMAEQGVGTAQKPLQPT